MKIYSYYLVICTHPNTEIISNMSTSDRFKKCLYESYRNQNSDSEVMEIICKKNTSLIFKHKCNYVTEILTGVKIPIMLDEYGVYGEKYSIGKIDKPYCVTSSWYLDWTLIFKHIPDLYEVKPEKLKEYIEQHRDADGTFTTFKNELESILRKAEANYQCLPVKQYKKPKTANDVYKEFKRTRKK